MPFVAGVGPLEFKHLTPPTGEAGRACRRKMDRVPEMSAQEGVIDRH